MRGFPGKNHIKIKMKKIITIASIIGVMLLAGKAKAQSIYSMTLKGPQKSHAMLLPTKDELYEQFTKSVEIKVVPGAQSVSAGGITIKLTDYDITWLRSLDNAQINAALDTHANIKYNATADLIIAIMRPKIEYANLIAKN